MTREEAILLLHDMKDTYDEIHENTNWEIGYEQMTALDMAIEALQADTVSREDTVTLNSPISIQADMVAVVRCKDCRYRNGKVNRKGFEVCDATGMDITDNDYCSWGERGEECT